MRPNAHTYSERMDDTQVESPFLGVQKEPVDVCCHNKSPSHFLEHFENAAKQESEWSEKSQVWNFGVRCGYVLKQIWSTKCILEANMPIISSFWRIGFPPMWVFPSSNFKFHPTTKIIFSFETRVPGVFS